MCDCGATSSPSSPLLRVRKSFSGFMLCWNHAAWQRLDFQPDILKPDPERCPVTTSLQLKPCEKNKLQRFKRDLLRKWRETDNSPHIRYSAHWRPYQTITHHTVSRSVDLKKKRQMCVFVGAEAKEGQVWPETKCHKPPVSSKSSPLLLVMCVRVTTNGLKNQINANLSTPPHSA